MYDKRLFDKITKYIDEYLYEFPDLDIQFAGYQSIFIELGALQLAWTFDMYEYQEQLTDMIPHSLSNEIYKKAQEAPEDDYSYIKNIMVSVAQYMLEKIINQENHKLQCYANGSSTDIITILKANIESATTDPIDDYLLYKDLLTNAHMIAYKSFHHISWDIPYIEGVIETAEIQRLNTLYPECNGSERAISIMELLNKLADYTLQVIFNKYGPRFTNILDE